MTESGIPESYDPDSITYLNRLIVNKSGFPPFDEQVKKERQAGIKGINESYRKYTVNSEGMDYDIFLGRVKRNRDKGFSLMKVEIRYRGKRLKAWAFRLWPINK